MFVVTGVTKRKRRKDDIPKKKSSRKPLLEQEREQEVEHRQASITATANTTSGRKANPDESPSKPVYAAVDGESPPKC